MGAHGLSGHSAKRRNPILHAVSPVSQNLYIESLNQFYIFLARKYASFGHSASFAIITESCRIWEQSTVSHPPPPPKKMSIFTARQHKFSPNVLIWSKYLSIMETTGWYLSIDICYVLVHCYLGMLMTSCLWGATSILGRKRITLLQPDISLPKKLIRKSHRLRGTSPGISYELWNKKRHRRSKTEYCYEGTEIVTFVVF